MSKSHQTTDKHTIKNWAEARNGVPAFVKDTENQEGDGILRIHFPEASPSNQSFEETSWDKFFQKFEDNDLAMVYQEDKENGEKSTFYKFIDRD
jgi:hypothetical protein